MSGYWSGILAILCINVIFAYSVFIPAAAISILIITLNMAGNYFKNKSEKETEVKYYIL